MDIQKEDSTVHSTQKQTTPQNNKLL